MWQSGWPWPRFPADGMRSTDPPRSSSQVARWSMTSRLLWSCASDVQLTDGVETSVRNISLMGGNFMSGRARWSGRAGWPKARHSAANTRCVQLDGTSASWERQRPERSFHICGVGLGHAAPKAATVGLGPGRGRRMLSGCAIRWRAPDGPLFLRLVLAGDRRPTAHAPQRMQRSVLADDVLGKNDIGAAEAPSLYLVGIRTADNAERAVGP